MRVFAVYKMGVIRVISTDQEDLLLSHEKILSAYAPSFGFQSVCIPNQECGVYNSETEQEAAEKIIKIGEQLQNDGMDAVFISCASDPGVSVLRKQLSIPVFSAGSALCLVARAINQPVGVLTIDKKIPECISSSLSKLLVGSRQPEGIKNTVDLMNRENKEMIIEAAFSLVRKGAKVLMLACTGFSANRWTTCIEEEINVPVLDPLRCSAAVMTSMMS